ncbi:MAG: hypothetical protein JSS22_10240 [Proteobacteria bacterium]|nr:hypothetical protein [Pseudomonadota bacterium]
MDHHQQRRTRRVYTVQLFAGELGISERTVWRMIAAQKIKTIKLSPGRTGIPASELDRVEAGGLAA